MDSNDDFQHIFGGRQDWQQQEPEVARPPGERREGKKQFVATLGNAPDRSQQQQDVQEQKKKHARIDDQEKGSQTMIFPIKLHRLLENGDGDSAAIVSWQPQYVFIFQGQIDQLIVSSPHVSFGSLLPQWESLLSAQQRGLCAKVSAEVSVKMNSKFVAGSSTAHNAELLLRSCFRQSMWASFQRQLNIYGKNL